MNFIVALYTSILFFILSPGILLCLPSRSASKYTIAMVHAAIFGLLIYFSQNIVWQLSNIVEGRSGHGGHKANPNTKGR